MATPARTGQKVTKIAIILEFFRICSSYHAKAPHETARIQPKSDAILAWAGLLIVFAGAVSYFVYFFRFPSLRDFPWLNLPIVILGFLMSAFGLKLAWIGPNRSLLARVFDSIAFFVSLMLTALFCGYVFVLSYRLPKTNDVDVLQPFFADFPIPLVTLELPAAEFAVSHSVGDCGDPPIGDRVPYSAPDAAFF